MLTDLSIAIAYYFACLIMADRIYSLIEEDHCSQLDNKIMNTQQKKKKE